MDQWPEETWMMQLAAENNLSETAFIVKEEAGYHLRWFTPGTEVELCGHATLASAYGCSKAAFGSRPIKAVLGLDPVCDYGNTGMTGKLALL